VATSLHVAVAVAVAVASNMTSHTGRLYSLALALVLFFVLWAGIAAHPWVSASASADPRAKALVAREQQLRRDSVIVKKLVARRWAVYRVQLAHRKAEIAAAHQRQLAATAAAARAPVVSASYSPSSYGASPAVRIVNLPPLTITRTS
jgi:hypothetical protein